MAERQGELELRAPGRPAKRRRGRRRYLNGTRRTRPGHIQPVPGSAPASRRPVAASCDRLLYDENPEVRVQATVSLGKIGREAVPALKEALASDDARVRELAASALRKLGVSVATEPASTE